MTTYPLLFRFSNLLVNGRGFAAGIVAEGRMLAEQEVDGWCINGVTPAGLAEGGQTLREALDLFRETFQRILFDIAADAEDFPAFEARAQAFFDEPPDSDLERWESALKEISANPSAQLDGLGRGDARRPCTITIERLDNISSDHVFTPEANSTDVFFLPEAA